MQRRLAFFFLLGALLALFPAVGTAAPAPAVKPPELPRGALIEKLTCPGNPEQSYALYLPSTYSPDRTWPILYAFDARGEALVPAKAFQEAAEKYGWIVVSSYNSASDGPIEPNFAAMRALWAETHARFAIDEKRVYAAGFSGTVRFSCILALSAPGSIAGVIGAGAGYPNDVVPKADHPFVFFGTVGDRDFNYYEMMTLDRNLEAVHLSHRIEIFDGTHAWPPAPLAGQAIAWMELAAMRTGKREKAPALVEPLWTADRERARSLEAEGKLWDARRLWIAMAEGYAGLRPDAEIAEAKTRSEEIAGREAFKKQAREWQERFDRDTKFLAEAPTILGQVHPGSEPMTVSQIAAQLKIPQLKSRAESPDPEERLSAKRLLSTLSAQTSFYLPQMLIEKKDYDRAVFMLSVAAEIRPESPWPWVQIAAAQARKGKAGRKPALDALRKALEKGLDDPTVLENEKAFADLRQDEGYRQILEQVRQKAPSPPAPLPAPPSPSPGEGRKEETTPSGAISCLPSPGGGWGGRWERGRG
jgi:predicted esterase